MFLPQLLQKLHALKIEFLLPLPILLIAFGIGGETLTNLLLSRTYHTVDKLQADRQTVKVQLVANVIVTAAEIKQEQKFTIVELQTANSVIKKLTFKVPVTELDSVRAMIAQVLGVSGEVEILQANTQMQVQSTVQVLKIVAEIDKEQGLTKVEINTANSILKNLELEFAITELNAVKAIIIQELGLNRENTRLLISYRVRN
ncbi:MAG: hypothetical protein KME23_18060 [Goleter apudmare HA4340-LM2]|jgi:hypothetical protein|nr:hypothetical protein [Goleter apudmare HA4340-LM2]